MKLGACMYRTAEGVRCSKPTPTMKCVRQHGGMDSPGAAPEETPRWRGAPHTRNCWLPAARRPLADKKQGARRAWVADARLVERGDWRAPREFRNSE